MKEPDLPWKSPIIDEPVNIAGQKILWTWGYKYLHPGPPFSLQHKMSERMD
jgi:hypothetical protein